MIKLRPLFLKIIPVMALGLLVFWESGFDWAKELEIKNDPIPPFSLFNFQEKIREAVLLLKSSPPLVYETKNRKPSGELARRQVALAVLDKNTGEISEKRIWVIEQEIKNYKKTGVLNIVSSQDTISQFNIDVKIKWWNSFNTFYEIENRPDLAVVANKYLLPSDRLSGLPEKSETKYTDIVYVPYSRPLHLPDIIEAGKRYLDDCVNRAFEQLESEGVVSRSLPGNSATAAVSKDFIKNIVLVEHIDPDSFLAAGDGGKELTERVLIIIGANQDTAYRYTGSPAGASGLAQFIKPTYQAIVAEYPEARLIKDYNLGMADHVNAVKAMVLFFDNYKKEIDDKITRRDVIGQIGITEEMLAAAYNGGPGKVARSVNKYGLAWISSQLNLPRAAAVFRGETINYVKKFQSVRSLGI
jgi:hypothetical protein